VNTDRKCVRTYMGHKEAVRDLYFTNDGLHFLSAGYDKLIHYWDTETGKAVKTFKLKKFPYCIRFNPDEDKQHTFLVGSSNKKIGQYDIRTGNRTQQYDEHLGAVNTITFIDNNRKFVSTSDDKKIFLWEFGIPVVVKHISEPEMHSITATDMHPSKKYFAGQSADNRVNLILILIFLRTQIYLFIFIFFCDHKKNETSIK
jgi:pre-mRNA-processing factor 17